MSDKTVKVQLVKSLIGTRESHRATVRGLGLRRLNSVSELQDTPAVPCRWVSRTLWCTRCRLASRQKPRRKPKS